MILFIPLTESTHYSPEYRTKILFNQDKFNGEEAAVCIGALQNLKTVIKLKNDSKVTLQSLLKGFPTTPGMNRSIPLPTHRAKRNRGGSNGSLPKS